MSTAQAAMEKIKKWRAKPILFVTEELKVTPDPWQEEGLRALEDPKNIRIGAQSCAGPGKTAWEAWIGWWWLSTMAEVGEHPKGAGVSITSDNLRDNLWTELAKWQSRSEFLKRAFTWNAERIYANDHPETWFMSARSWPKTASPEEQGKTLSGFHSLFPLFLIDESGGIPLTVARAAEQALTSAKRGLIIQAGNPITRDGMLHMAATTLRHMWHMIRITGDPDDPKRSARVDIDWARQQIAAYGRDNPWVMAYILGEFPPASINVLLGSDEVEQAMSKTHPPVNYEHSQKRLGIDVARQGDDRTVLFPRQGLQAFPPVILRNARGPEVASRAARAMDRWEWETSFVDDTGGFGGSVVDSMHQGGLPHVPINFASKPDDSRYLNKRAEMWFRLAEWVKRGGCLPKMPDLVRELTTPTYTFVNGKFQIEPKEQIKKRLGFSPDLADGLALTFAWEEMPSKSAQELKRGGRIVSEWDPMREQNEVMAS